jgi:AcrR family transcriptional regulator
LLFIFFFTNIKIGILFDRLADKIIDDEKDDRANEKRRIMTDKNTQLRSEIYRKALGLFLEKGYGATSLAMIVKRLGMNKANLYYYVQAKKASYIKFTWRICRDVLSQLLKKPKSYLIPKID